ncbi:hypothetical protein ACDA63_18705 [Uliginosibacterium sp. sgz301328]|uniref:hypothetical protein n=1 Tax=Uliginosibacterium sp. sgz301328 TaxID=3243764 RepID=UPI00359EDF18
MNKIQRAGLSAISVALLAALTACGGDDGNDDNGGSVSSASSSSSSTSSSSASSASVSSSSSSSSSAAGTKTCPADYRSITVSGSFIANANLSISSPDGKAQLTAKAPATNPGNFKLCVGTPAADQLPASAGARNYEVIGEGAYAALLNPTLTITYATAGNITIDHLPIPASGAYGGTPDRHIAAAVTAQGSAFTYAVDAMTPGLYMTSEPTP